MTYPPDAERDISIYSDPAYSDEARLLASIDYRLMNLERVLVKLEPLLELAARMANGDMSKKEKLRMVLNARKHPEL